MRANESEKRITQIPIGHTIVYLRFDWRNKQLANRNATYRAIDFRRFGLTFRLGSTHFAYVRSFH